MLVIGAGFTGSEIASACRSLGLAVTVTSATPLSSHVRDVGSEAGVAIVQ